MTKKVEYFLILSATVLLFCAPSFAQNSERAQISSDPGPQEQLQNPANANSTESVATEIALLRKSLQTLNTRLREITDKVLADSKQGGSNTLVVNLDLLAHAEQRAEIMRKLLLELIEKETALKIRQTQIEEDMRPENIERAMNGIGSTRTVEMRDTRRRVLETERRGVESLLNLTTQGRIKLEEDLRQADALVARLKQRLLPLIDKEIDKLSPN
jgi:phosphoenolpyruvate-protein kinase (PTS system EI component)